MNINESPFGHWVVAGKKYYNKLQAVVDSVPKGWWPHFYFHEDKFSKFDWTTEPVETLTDLYKKRALSLRQKFDHITIEFSGGADSWTALYSFLRQGLHVVSYEGEFKNGCYDGFGIMKFNDGRE